MIINKYLIVWLGINVFLNCKNLSLFFEKDYKIPVASYNTEKYDDKYISIPFNILCCDMILNVNHLMILLKMIIIRL